MGRGRKDLTIGDKTSIFHSLLEGSINGKPVKGKMKELADSYGCHWKCISRIWKEANQLKAQGVPVIFKNKKKAAVRPKVHVPDLEAIRKIDGKKRQHIRDLAMLIPPSKSTIGRWMMLGLLNFITNSMKPCLTPACKLMRLRFSLKAIQTTGSNNSLMYKNMHNIIHVDEKWFNQKKANMKVISVPGEEDVYRQGNKQHIPKVSFICVVAKPLFAIDKSCIFDGKIGVWDFTEKVQVARGSRNRPPGTWITKPLDSINRDVYKDTLINKILPAIKAKWPHNLLGKTIFIQQDNAPTHIRIDDPDFVLAATVNGWNIQLICQPANSPDLNINDLGWFRSLQSLQHKTLMRNIDELVVAVQQSYVDLPPTTLSDVFLSLQGVMTEILKVKGHNNYKLPHLKKNTLRIQGNLPDNLEVDPELVRECMLYLMEVGGESDFEELTQSLGVGFMLT